MKNNEKIEALMSGCYEPTLADCTRIYKEYSFNKGEIAAVLSDVFNWLTQEPICHKYMDGTIYLRAEACSKEVLCVHYIYANEIKGIVIDEKIACDDDITDQKLISFLSEVKNEIKETIAGS